MEILTEDIERELFRTKEALKRKTEELANSLLMMRATLESTTDAIVVTDGTAKVTGFNEKYVEMLGLSRKTIDSASVQQLREIFSQQFKDPQQFLSRIKDIYTSSPPESFDVLEFADGRVFERYPKLQQIDNWTAGRGSGYELVREAKQRQPLKGIALSGFGAEEDVRRSIEAGFDYHLTKPVSFQDLRSLLQKIA